jgi:hypothetical protein
MTVRSDANLLTLANTIKNEASAGANTAIRVGNLLVDLVDSKINVSGVPAPGSTGNLLYNAGGVVGAQSLVNIASTDALVFGTASAAAQTTGHLRFEHNKTLAAGRNQANNADVTLLQWGVTANNRLTIGSTGVAEAYFNIATSGTYVVQVNGTTEYTFSATLLDMTNNSIQFGTNPATTGLLRIAHGVSTVIVGRNAANNADVGILQWGVGVNDQMIVGSNSVSNMAFQILTGTNYNFFTSASGTQIMTLSAASLTFPLAAMPITNVSRIDFGATPATSGTIRLGNNQSIQARNNGNSANATVLNLSTGDDLTLGGGTVVNNIFYNFPNTSGFHIFQVNGTNKFTVGNSAIDFGDLALNNMGNIDHDGTTIGLFGTTPTTKQTVTGAKGSNAALGSLMTALAAYGLVTDSTSA